MTIKRETGNLTMRLIIAGLLDSCQEFQARAEAYFLYAILEERIDVAHEITGLSEKQCKRLRAFASDSFQTNLNLRFMNFLVAAHRSTDQDVRQLLRELVPELPAYRKQDFILSAAAEHKDQELCSRLLDSVQQIDTEDEFAHRMLSRLALSSDGQISKIAGEMAAGYAERLPEEHPGKLEGLCPPPTAL